jgi:hypothetical protein
VLPLVGDTHRLLSFWLAQVLAVVGFSVPLYNVNATAGSSFITGRWSANNTQLVVTLLDTRGVSIADSRIGLAMCSVLGIRDSSGQSSTFSVSAVPINGSWGQSSTPKFLANGRGFEVANSGGQAGPGARDTIYLRFNQPLGTDTVPIATKADIDAVFAFSTPIGNV